MEENEKDAMKQPPRSSSDGIFAGGVAYDVLYQGVIVAVLTVIAYLVGHLMETGEFVFTTSEHGITMAFLTLSMAEIFQSFNMRSRRGSLFTMKKQNVILWGAAGAALLLTTAVIYIPVFAKMFEFSHINIVEYFTALGIAFLIIPIVEAVKLIQRLVAKKKAAK
jgi:Ca2+-transporting ATPase